MARFNQFGQDDGGGWFFQQQGQFDNAGANFMKDNWGSIDRDGDGIPDFLGTDFRRSWNTDFLSDNRPFQTYDQNYDGVPDHWLFDSNQDGKVDTWAYDRDKDGRPDEWAYDKNGDGKPDLWAYDRNGDGISDAWAFDTNNDGLKDQWAYDKNFDGKPDYWEADFNRDGKIDQWGYDKNNDGKQDYWEIDTNGDGKINQWVFDKNSDGLADYWIGDRSGDGKKDIWGFDKNNDGKLDYRAFDTNKDGKPDYWERDSNGNGIFDQCAFDKNKDGKPDKWNVKKRDFIIVLHEETIVGNMGLIKQRIQQTLEPFVKEAGKQLKLVVSRIPTSRKHLEFQFPPSAETNADLHLFFYGGTKFTGPGMDGKGGGLVLGDGTGNISVDSHRERRYKGLRSVFEFNDKGLAIDIGNSAAHEIGHMLGLEHSNNPKSCMFAGETTNSLKSINTFRRFLTEEKSFFEDTTSLIDKIRMGKYTVNKQFRVKGSFGK